MDVPTNNKLGIPAGLFAVSLLAAIIGGSLVTFFYFPKIKIVEKEIQSLKKEVGARTYKSDQYSYAFSYLGDWRLERGAKGEGGYVQEAIDLYEPTGRIRLSVKVIAKNGVQCPFYSLDQFVRCAFLRWQNQPSAPITVGEKKGTRFITQSQLPPYDLQVVSYFEKGNYIFEVTNFFGNDFDKSYLNFIDQMSF